MEQKAERNSAHELLRIIAMLFIVWYHFVTYWLYETSHESLFNHAIEAYLPTLHIGVILFLLISGYYGIKPSVSGFLRLLFITAFYFLPIEIVRCIHHHGNMLQTLMFITNTPYWFIRTYLLFYLISPMVNKFIKTSNLNQCNYMLLALATISIYFGTTGGDDSLAGGKNLTNFTFLYLWGHTLHHYQSIWAKFGRIKLFMVFVFLNLLLIAALTLTDDCSTLRQTIFTLSFPYCSPILIVNATLLFMIFTLIQFHSKIINNIASSMFAVYLIHCHPAVHKYIIIPITECISNGYVSHCAQIRQINVLLFLFGITALVVMIGCVCVDKCLTPVWNIWKKYSINYK